MDVNNKKTRYVREGLKLRPVLYDVDVAVAGSGVCSSFAAIAAGRCGARTLVIERYPMLGGNIGPGMILAGSLFGEHEKTLPGGISGIAREFRKRLESLRVGPPERYPEEASIASQVLYDMMRAAGVEILYPAHVSDPIVEKGVVKGLFVECKGGRLAVLAKITIDGTGDAEVARRAGARIINFLRIASGKGVDGRYKTPQVPEGMIRDKFMNKAYPTYFNDTALLCLLAGVDLKRYERFLKKKIRISPADRKIANRHFCHMPQGLWPLLVRAWRNKTLPIRRTGPDFKAYVIVSRLRDQGGICSMAIGCRGAINPADPRQLAEIESDLRSRAFRAVTMLQRGALGFEKAYVVGLPVFLGFRGGPHIEAEHILTLEEMFSGAKFDDVLYRNIHEMNHGGDKSGFDVPYRCVLPKNIDGLLVCGRGAAYLRRGHDPTGMRCRPAMMVFGQTVGTAAAIASRAGVTPKKVDIRKVQKRLIKDGIVLGDRQRLKELGLA